MASISDSKLKILKKFYYDRGFSMKRIAMELDVSWDAVLYFMRKHNLTRRSPNESNHLAFKNKPLSFVINDKKLKKHCELALAGVMLYWAEGTKSNKFESIDFANSDPKMILIFLDFLRKVFCVSEDRLKIYLYCHSNQNVEEIKKFWSGITSIPLSQFSKPYIKQDSKKNGRIMTYGLIHLRYNDKKLYLEIMKMIEEYKQKFAPIV
ncbi:MAG: hypothetical protein WCI52_00820 [bacterium]